MKQVGMINRGVLMARADSLAGFLHAFVADVRESDVIHEPWPENGELFDDESFPVSNFVNGQNLPGTSFRVVVRQPAWSNFYNGVKERHGRWSQLRERWNGFEFDWRVGEWFVPFDTRREDFDREEWRPGSVDRSALALIGPTIQERLNDLDRLLSGSAQLVDEDFVVNMFRPWQGTGGQTGEVWSTGMASGTVEDNAFNRARWPLTGVPPAEVYGWTRGEIDAQIEYCEALLAAMEAEASAQSADGLYESVKQAFRLFRRGSQTARRGT